MQHTVLASPPARAAPPGLAEELTPEQRAAVAHGDGPLLIFAGPGTGKTRTLTHRIAHLLDSGRARPGEVLAVTFTVAAAAEMRERLAALLGRPAISGLSVCTFHAVCARLLRAHGACFGRSAHFTVYDQADIAALVGGLLEDRVRARGPAANGRGAPTPADEVVAETALAKNRLWSPDHYMRRSRHPLAALIASVWAESERELRASDAFDFDDLLLYGVRLLAEHPALRAHYRARWRWVLVDEFQDTNHAQMALVSLLAGPAGNLTVVCDDDQLLYRFRGAQAANVLGFGEWFASVATVTLTRNFRSRAEILDAAARCVAHNRDRVPKALVAERGRGGRIDAPLFANEHAEAAWVARLIAERLEVGEDPTEILVMARAAYVLRAIEQALAARGVPYRVLGSLGLFERAAVRDALAYLSVLANPRDAQALRRAIAAPRRGVGEAGTARVVAWAREHGGDLIAACAHAEQIDGLRRAARGALRRFGEQMAALRSDLHAGDPVARVVVATLTQPGGLVAHHRAARRNAASAQARAVAGRALEDLRSLCRAVADYERQERAAATLTGFLERACGLDGVENGDHGRRVTLSTIHRAKGSEARLVLLLGCEERLLPSWRSLADHGDAGLQEERRLFYVACTRARDHLVLTGARQRSGRDTDGPSRFLAEAGV